MRWNNRMRIFFLLLAALAPGGMLVAQQRPNVVIILADDLGYGDVQCYNPDRGKISTPNIDRLAAEGIRFTDAHSSSGICSPSRYTLITGRYHWRTRMQKGLVGMWEPPVILPGRLTIGGLARSAGYTSGVVGKWHLGWNWPIDSADRPHFTNIGPFEGVYKNENAPRRTQATDADREAWARTFKRSITGGPIELGFDSYFGTDVPNWPPFCYIENDHTVGMPTELLGPGRVDINQASFQGPALKDWDLEEILPEITHRAVSFIGENARKGNPFLLYFPLTSPHTPLAVAEKWKNKSGLDNRYADFVMQTDAVVGQVLEALKHNGIDRNTIVIFTSDNGCGPYIGAKELEAKGHYVSGPLRGYKGDVWEGGHRVPFIVKYPGVVQPGSANHQLIHQADIMATLADILGRKLPPDAGVDSYSFLPLLKGKNKPVRPTAVSCRADGIQGIRKGSWKLICTAKPQLFDLSTDIGETRDLAAEKPKLVAEMLKLRKEMIVNGRSTKGPRQDNDVEVVINKGPGL